MTATRQRRIGVAASVAIAASLTLSCASSADPKWEIANETLGGSVDVDSVLIAYRLSRGRTPAVVFDAGLGHGAETWDDVFPAVSTFRSAIAYSRPGLGESGPSPMDGDGVRTSTESARLLKRLLETLDVPPPYILVGHSLGGLNMLKFAELYPKDAAALVLVDSRPRAFRARCVERGAAFCSTPRVASADWPLAIRAEIAGIGLSENASPTAESLGTIPVTVITSTTPWPGEAGASAFPIWLEAQEEFANALMHGRFVRAEGAGHYVQEDNPQLVIDEIQLIADHVVAKSR